MKIWTENSTYTGYLAGMLCLALIAGMIGALEVAEQQRPASARASELSYLPKGEYLKVAVLGYRQMVADLIWLKVVQHFGDRKTTQEGYQWTYHAVDVLTDLDPKFAYAYQATGTMLGVWARRPEEAVAILTKGIQHNPEVWELPFFAGYVYYYELQNASEAATHFRRASELPGSPAYLPNLAARMSVEAGDPDAALEFLQRLQEQMSDERLKASLLQRMREVAAERDIRFLEEGVRRYHAKYHKPPRLLRDLVTGRIIFQLPVDPLGGTYELLPDGTVHSTGLRERLRVHRHQ
jgi:tetratricopeptide (TPR) repeat protein